MTTTCWTAISEIESTGLWNENCNLNVGSDEKLQRFSKFPVLERFKEYFNCAVLFTIPPKENLFDSQQLQLVRGQAVTLASFHTFISAIISSAESLVSARRPTTHVQASLQLGLVVDRESPQAGDELGVASLEVWVVKMMKRHAVTVVDVFNGWICFPEAVQVELTDKAREVGRFEGVGVVRGVARTQDLPLEELLIDDDELAEAVPADGFVCRVVHQTPQFGREVIRVDAVRKWTITNIHAFVCRSRIRGEVREHNTSPHLDNRPTVKLLTVS